MHAVSTNQIVVLSDCELIQLCKKRNHVSACFCNTHQTISYKKNYFFLDIYSFRSSIIFQFLFHFRVRRHIFPIYGVLITQEIPNQIIILWIDYDVLLGYKKLKAKRSNFGNFEVLVFSVQAFKKITQIFPNLLTPWKNYY